MKECQKKESLMHYGVKGMKWGVRKVRNPVQKSSSNRTKHFENQKTMQRSKNKNVRNKKNKSSKIETGLSKIKDFSIYSDIITAMSKYGKYFRKSIREKNPAMKSAYQQMARYYLNEYWEMMKNREYIQ